MRTSLVHIYERFNADERITPWHISVYMSLFYLWSTAPDTPLRVTRKKLMKLSHINSFMTYHKCIRQLVEYGYIKYTPSYHPLLGSTVSLLFH